jgi:uncharacterized protein with GYD domain
MLNGREDGMAILITQARFTQEGSKGTTATPENRVKAASQLVAKAGGTLIAYYLTSGDYDLLLIFQASSYEETVPALATAAAEIGVADLNTVTVQSGGMERAVVDTRSAAADHRPAGAGVADLLSTEPTADLHTPDPQHEDTTGEVQADAEAATRILDAHKKAVSDIAAGRPAPYYLVPPPTAAPSKTTPAHRADSKDAAKKKPAAGKVSSNRIRKT